MGTDQTLKEIFGDVPYRVLVEEIKDFAIFHLDTEGRIVSWNAGAERLFGYTAGAVIGKLFKITFTPEDVETGIPARELERAQQEGRAEDVRWHLCCDGTRFYASGVTTALYDQQGTLLGFAKVARDDTARKLAEDSLAKSEERFKLIARATNDAVWDWDLISNEVWWNDGVRTLFGYTREQVRGYSTWWYEHIHPEDRERVVSGIHTVIDSGGEKWSAEYRYLHADGTYADIFDRGFAVHRDGKPVRMLGAMQDITSRKQAEEAFRRSQERLQLALMAPQVGLWYCDLPFNELMWSERTKEHFWLPPEARVTIELFYERLHPDDRERTRLAIERSIATRTNYDIEYRTIEPHDAGIKWIHAMGRCLYDEAGLPYCFDGITIDVTSRKQQERELEQLLARELEARQQADEANRLKDEFLATLSHELRTPLTAILGWSRLLRTGGLDQEMAARALEIIERNARTQNQLINDILDVSRIITGKLRLDVRAVELLNVIESATDTLRPAAEAKSIRLHLLLDPSADMVSGDPDRLQQVVWNLISNAIKFTPKGGRVQVRLERINSHVEVTVSDTGQGIAPEFLPHVFDRFRQADATTTRTHGGLGLGLAIVRQLVELHGGTVIADSKGEGQGATFAFTLPVLPMRASTTDAGRVHPQVDDVAALDCPPRIEGLRVLVVDDEPDTRELLRVVLEGCGAHVRTEGSAVSALEALKQEAFDVLVSDIGMPGEDGYTFIAKVRALGREQGGRIPAAVLTAFAREEDRIRSLWAGFQIR
ncbi:MAG: PAS domain S-box protein [Acidobacteriota bacterium]|nr:PAS domain S-box protein [Acidobacteriota bacterium]